MFLSRSIEDFHKAVRGRSGAADRKGIAATVGNFDGMHLGHRRLIETLDPEALKVLITFYPHPRVFFTGKAERQYYLTPLREKISLAERLGVDCFFLIHFTQRIAALSPEMFVERYLRNGLGVKQLVVGHDWRFGKGRLGDAALMRQLGERHGISVQIINPVTVPDPDGGEPLRVSSGSIRDALGRGDVRRAAALLGRDFSINGRVRVGERRGRSLGFPTANLEMHEQFLPADGVYATTAAVGGRDYQAVTNVGERPTFGGGRRIVETHLLGAGEVRLYGELLKLTFIERIRGEERFASAARLQEAIGRDIQSALAILGARKTPAN